MTYTEIYNIINTQPNIQLTEKELTACNIILLFCRQKGFKNWWYGDIAEDEIRDEIFDEIVKLI